MAHKRYNPKSVPKPIATYSQGMEVAAGATGEEFFQHALPHERSGRNHWRGRIGDKLDILLQEIDEAYREDWAFVVDYINALPFRRL